MTTSTGETRDLRDGIQSYGRGGTHPTPAEKERKKKKRRNRTKEKNKPLCEQKKRGHPNTPSCSDDSEKPQTQQSVHTEKIANLNEVKGHVKERSVKKWHKGKTTQAAREKTSDLDEEDEMEGRSPRQESLRWEGALDDPVAEAERLEIYKANRRERYITFRQALLENTNVALGSESDVTKLGRTCKAGSAASM